MISILLPTRHRLKELERMVRSLRAVSCITPEVVVYIDDDDGDSVDKAKELDIKYRVGPKLMFTDYWNKCYEISTGDILMMAADDIVFGTQNWDVMVEECFAEYPDKIVMVYGDDMSPWARKINFPTHPIIHRRWAEAVGYFSPPYFSYGSCDAWLNDIALFLGRKRWLPFITEHVHYTEGKSILDETYKEGIARSKENNMTERYADLFFERLGDCEKLKAAIEMFEQQQLQG